jgi:hypothetical protein
VLPVSSEDECARIRRYVAGFVRDPADDDDLARKSSCVHTTRLCTDRVRQRMRAPLDSGTSPDHLDVADAAAIRSSTRRNTDLLHEARHRGIECGC